MGANIITGYTGTRHITPAMDAAIYRSAFGPDSYILSDGNQLEGSMPDINNFTVMDGLVSMQGHQIQITQETLSVDTCANGYSRIDLICLRFTHDNGTLVDAASLVVIKGSEVQNPNTPSVPTYNTGTIDSGATIVDMPLYRIDLDGSTVTYELVAPIIDTTLFGLLVPDGAGSHNAIYRGKYLGSSVTADQYAEIQAGTFHDMFIGDYWTIGGVNWRIADFDYWLGSGDTECTDHHAVIVPDTILATAQMNTSNVVTGAYVGSKMYTTNLATAKNTINTAFSGHVLSHKEYLKNAVTNGYETGAAWLASTVELMTEEMVYGSTEFKNRIQGTNFAYQHTVENAQLALFRHDHSRIIARDGNDVRSSWWLRDVANATSFAYVGSHGLAGSTGASDSLGVRPAFGIC